jgi:multicomponent Na+:H+ antiporter subunit C
MRIYLLCFILFSVGLYGILAKRNLIRIIVGLIIAECAVNLFFVLTAYRLGGVAPILEAGSAGRLLVDPLPQALVLTAIVIGLATTALAIAIAIRIHRHFGTYDIEKIRELRG